MLMPAQSSVQGPSGERGRAPGSVLSTECSDRTDMEMVGSRAPPRIYDQSGSESIITRSWNRGAVGGRAWFPAQFGVSLRLVSPVCQVLLQVLLSTSPLQPHHCPGL